MNMEAAMIDIVQELFDTGSSHLMLNEVKLKSSWVKSVMFHSCLIMFCPSAFMQRKASEPLYRVRNIK